MADIINLRDMICQLSANPTNSLNMQLNTTVTGRYSFVSAGFTNGQFPFYYATDGSLIEYGIGTLVTGSPDVIQRTTVLGGSSGAGVKVTFSGEVTVWNEVPSERMVYRNSSNVFNFRGYKADGITSINGGSFSSVRNILINGKFTNWQRATSFSTPVTASPICDGFRVNWDGSGKTFSVSKQTATDAALLDLGIRNFCRIDCTVAGTGATGFSIFQNIEEATLYSAKTLRLSFLCRTDSSRSIGFYLTQSFGSGGSPSSNVSASAPSQVIGSSWEWFSQTITLPSVFGKTFGSNLDDIIQLVLQFPVNVIETIDIAAISLVPGEWNTDIEWLPNHLEIERAYRRYQTRTVKWAGTVTTGHTIRITDTFPVEMAFTPSVAVLSSTLSGIGALSIAALTTKGVEIYGTASGTGQASFTATYEAASI